MNSMILEGQYDVKDEEVAPNSRSSFEESADDRLAHLLLTAWIAIVKEESK